MNSEANENPNCQSAFLRIFNNIEVLICITTLTLMVTIVFIQVVCRYVFLHPLGWPEEVTRLLMIWSTFGCASYAFRIGVNVGVTFLVDKVPGRGQLIANIIIKLAIIAFFLVVLFFGSQAALNVVGKSSPAANIPYVLSYSALPVGALMVIVRIVQQIITSFREGPAERAQKEGATCQ